MLLLWILFIIYVSCLSYCLVCSFKYLSVSIPGICLLPIFVHERSSAMVTPRYFAAETLSSSTLCRMYLVLVRWPPCELVQRQVARCVNNNYFDMTPGCISKKVSDLGWEPLQNWQHYKRSSWVWYKQALVILYCPMTIKRTTITSGQQRLYQPAATITAYENSFFTRNIKEWNLLPISVTGGIPSRSRCCPTDPAAINYYNTCLLF